MALLCCGSIFLQFSLYFSIARYYILFAKTSMDLLIVEWYYKQKDSLIGSINFIVLTSRKINAAANAFSFRQI